MPKIRIVEKDLTQNPSPANYEDVVFLTDSKAADTPTFVKAGFTVEYDNKEVINQILALGGKVLVAKSYAGAKDYLKDRNQFNIKFLYVKQDAKDIVEVKDAEGSKASSEEVLHLTSALEIAVARRDCVVIYEKTRKTFESNETSLFKDFKTSETDEFLKGETGTYGKYCLAFFAEGLKEGETTLGAGMAYILAFFNSKRAGNAEWLAVAGAKRGVIPGENLTCDPISESQIDAMQPRVSTENKHAINPIINVSPWGVRIWGNRTAEKIGAEGLLASHFANIRILMCDIKKRLYLAARTYQFEQDSDILWVNFTSKVNELLEEMKQSYGIAGYKWIREETKERAKLKAVLRIIPIEAVEDFDLTVDLTDSLEVAE